MNLYFSPLACSLATRIALYEADAQVQYTQVDTRAKRIADGSDFMAVAPMGQVPALRTDDGTVLTENTAVLQYVADRYPAAHLAPGSGLTRARLQQWLGFIGTEIHKAIFIPLLDPRANDAVKAYAREKIPLRMGVLQQHLADNEFLLPQFSVADAYLVTVLNWSAFTGVDLAQWPAVRDYFGRIQKRPNVARAFADEFALYREAQAKVQAVAQR
jgi:glutathione S-transferase